tara:strand:- start:4164 stop:4877 length:714 start_codon:yes stop_codon:yes gene_type:complete
MIKVSSYSLAFQSPLFLVLLVAIIGVVPLGAQTDALVRVRALLGEGATSQIEAAIQLGLADGLPRNLLVDKAIEGAAKGMGSEVILAAVYTLTDELRQAGTVVGLDADEVNLEKAADGLRSGLDQSFLVELYRENSEDFAMVVVALEDLLRTGVTVRVAQNMLRDASSRGLRVNELLRLPANVRRLVREGRTPFEAVRSVRASMRSGRRPPYPYDGTPNFSIHRRHQTPIQFMWSIN